MIEPNVFLVRPHDESFYSKSCDNVFHSSLICWQYRHQLVPYRTRTNPVVSIASSNSSTVVTTGTAGV